jgi:tetratricopeptide (TPR) repeat protein
MPMQRKSIPPFVKLIGNALALLVVIAYFCWQLGFFDPSDTSQVETLARRVTNQQVGREPAKFTLKKEGSDSWQAVADYETEIWDVSIIKKNKEFSANAVQRIPDEYKKASELFKKKDYATAINLYGDVISLNRGFVAEAYYSRAASNFNLQNYSKAAMDATEAIKRNFSLGDSYSLRAESILAAGTDESSKRRALADFDNAIVASPSTAELFRSRGRLLRELKEYNKAIADLDRAISLNGSDSKAYYERYLAKKARAPFFGDDEYSADRVKAKELGYQE